MTPAQESLLLAIGERLLHDSTYEEEVRLMDAITDVQNAREERLAKSRKDVVTEALEETTIAWLNSLGNEPFELGGLS